MKSIFLFLTLMMAATANLQNQFEPVNNDPTIPAPCPSIPDAGFPEPPTDEYDVCDRTECYSVSV